MKSIKFLLDKKWAKDFFRKKTVQYFPPKKLIDCEVEPLKIYLDYKSLVAKYYLKLSDKKNRISEKKIIGKAEKLREKSNISVDYSTTKFLRGQGLGNIIPKPIDYLPLFNLYLYEFVPGYSLQKLSVEHKDREFLDKIPSVVNCLKRIHKIKARKKNEIVRKDERQEKKEQQYNLKLVRHYYPETLDKILLWLQKCQLLRDKYRKYFGIKFYQMTHGDFYSRNILINKGKIKLIDFSNSAFYEPLNDISNFLINTELMFEYDFPNSHCRLMEKLKDIFFQIYFPKPRTEEQEFKINYFVLTNLIRIIALAAMSEGNKKLPNKPSIVMNKLIRFGEEKYNNL